MQSVNGGVKSSYMMTANSWTRITSAANHLAHVASGGDGNKYGSDGHNFD